MILTSIQNILYECQNLSFSKDWLHRTNCLKTGCMQDTIYAFFYVRLWFLPVSYSCTVQPNHDLFIYTYYFISKLIAMHCEFQREKYKCVFYLKPATSNEYLQFCRTLNVEYHLHVQITRRQLACVCSVILNRCASYTCHRKKCYMPTWK